MASVRDVSKAAVFLLGSPSYKKIKAQLVKTVAEFDAVPMNFSGPLEPLNALVELGVHHPLKFEKAMEMIRTRRRELERMTEDEQRVKRNAYMRKYMRQYRRRERGDRPTKSQINQELTELLK